MAQCPNKSIPEWKNMVRHVGEFEAYRAYLAHSETIPNAMPMVQLKGIIGLKGGLYSADAQAAINKKIIAFNNENGTSHRVIFTKRGKSESLVGKLDINYLPMIREVEIESMSPATARDTGGPKYGPYIEVKRAELATYRADSAEQDRIRKKNLRDVTMSEEGKAAARRKTAQTKSQIAVEIKAVEDELVKLENYNRLGVIEQHAEDDMKKIAKILENPNSNVDGLELAAKLIHVWQEGGDFSGNVPHPYFSPAELAVQNTDSEIMAEKAKFMKWMDQANGFNITLMERQEEYLGEKITGTMGFGGLTAEDLDFDRPLPDISFLVKNLLDLSEIDHIIFQATARWLKDANNAARLDMNERFETLDKLFEATRLNKFDVFQQTISNTDSRITGDLVHVWTQDFHKEIGSRKGIYYNNIQHARTLDSKGRNELEQATIKEFFAQMQEDTTTIDLRILFPDDSQGIGTAKTDNEIQAYKDDLKELLGETMYDIYMEEAKNKLDLYKEDLDAFEIITRNDPTVSPALQKVRRDEWVAEHSPFLFAETLENGYDNTSFSSDGQSYKPKGNSKYVVAMPKDKDTGYYDNKFAEVSKNESYMNLYKEMVGLMEDMKILLPFEKVDKGLFSMNALPVTHKKTLEAMVGKGLRGGFDTVKDDVIQATRTDDLGTIGTAKGEPSFQLQMLNKHGREINQRIKLKSLAYESNNNGEQPDADMIKEWKNELINEFAKEQSFDLPRIMKAFTSMALTYHHKSAIEDQMRISHKIIRRSVQKQTNALGEQKTDEWGNELTEKGLESLNYMYEGFMNTAYWSYPSNKPEGAGKKKVLTSSEKNLQEIIRQSLEDLEKIAPGTGVEGELKEDEYEVRKKFMKDELENLGGVRTYSKYGDILLKYIQLKGMGWNVLAGFANIGFGIISNVIEGADGRNYSQKNMRRANMLMMNSIAKNASFHIVETGTATKIATLMHDMDVLKQSANEIYKSTGENRIFKKVKGRIQFLDPYNIQARSEFINQAPVMIAMMMTRKVKNAAGEEISLWDAYDNEGNLAEGTVLTDVEESESVKRQYMSMIKGEIDQVVKMKSSLVVLLLSSVLGHSKDSLKGSITRMVSKITT